MLFSVRQQYVYYKVQVWTYLQGLNDTVLRGIGGWGQRDARVVQSDLLSHLVTGSHKQS